MTGLTKLFSGQKTIGASVAAIVLGALTFVPEVAAYMPQRLIDSGPEFVVIGTLGLFGRLGMKKIAKT